MIENVVLSEGEERRSMKKQLKILKKINKVLSKKGFKISRCEIDNTGIVPILKILAFQDKNKSL